MSGAKCWDCKRALFQYLIFNPPEHTYTIALLNTTSILTETWLAPNIHCPDFVVGHNIVRADRQAIDSKDGVLISTQAHFMKSYQLTGLIEALDLMLPNGTTIDILLVYPVPPLVIYCTCIWCAMFCTWWLQWRPLDQTSWHHLVFTQLVTTPTTDNGSLIDHIYTLFHLKIVTCGTQSKLNLQHSSLFPEALEVLTSLIIRLHLKSTP